MTGPVRYCLAFEQHGQCLKPATHVCGNEEHRPIEWYACEQHAQVGAEHAGTIIATVTPLAEWRARHGLSP